MKRKGRKPLETIMAKSLYTREPLRPEDLFSDETPNIIAEFKRKSPSKGIINQSVSPVNVVESYKNGGAAAVSILTDRDFFGGSFQDLEVSKNRVPNIPLLRKDFMIDPYQVHEAKAYGADIILLIAAILSKNDVAEMAGIARSIGLSVLLEVHGEEEVDKWTPDIGLIGVNNRDLRNFKTDINLSFNLFSSLPAEAIKISESGIQNPEEVVQLYSAGFRGFLMGERFMASEDPGLALEEFITSLKRL